MPVGAACVSRGAALGRRDVPRARRACCTSEGCRPRSATRAASRPTSPRTKTRCRLLVEAIEQRGLHARRPTSRSRSTPRPPSSSATAATSWRARAARCSPASSPSSGPSWVDRYPIVSIEDGMAEDDWDGWRALTDARSAAGAARRRRPVRHEHRAAREGHRPRASRTRSSSRSTRSARSPRRSRRSRWRRGELHERDVAPLGRDRGRHDRRPRRRDRTAARSRPARRRVPTASPSTTSCCASRKTSASRRRTRAGPRSAPRSSLVSPPRDHDPVDPLLGGPAPEVGDERARTGCSSSRPTRSSAAASASTSRRASSTPLATVTRRHGRPRPIDPERIIDPELRQRLHPEPATPASSSNGDRPGCAGRSGRSW